MVSVLRSWKGHQYFISAAQKVLEENPHVFFLIVGEGPCRQVIEESILKNKISKNVLLLGHREDVSDILSSLNILVHPSYANEGIPQTLLQSMAVQTPIIASDLEPIKEVIQDHQTGLLSPIKNADVLAQKINYLLDNPELQKKLCEEAHKKVLAKYTLSHMVENIEKLYETCVY